MVQKKCSRFFCFLLNKEAFFLDHPVESHIIQNYLSENDHDVQFEIQYIQVHKTNDQFEFSASDNKLRERDRKVSDIENKNSRKRKSSELQREKSKNRNATDE